MVYRRCYLRTVRLATGFAIAGLVGACTDLRDFRGDWHGHRIGETESVRVGVTDTAEANLAVATIDQHGLQGSISVDKLVAAETPFVSLAGAEADKLAAMSFAGNPIRVYMGFVDTADGAGDAMAMIALFDEHRIELRLLRGGTEPLYGIFELSETP